MDTTRLSTSIPPTTPTSGRRYPVAAKYASLTPYNYSFNNPAGFSDPSGADPDPQYQNPNYQYYYHNGGGAYGQPGLTYDDYDPMTKLATGESQCARCWDTSNMMGWFGGGGLGITPGSGGHWADGMRSASENFGLMSTNAFTRFYRIGAGMSDRDRVSLANGLAERPNEEWQAKIAAAFGGSAGDNEVYIPFILSPAVYSVSDGRIADQHTALAVIGFGKAQYKKMYRDGLGGQTQGGCPPGVDCDYIANAAKNGLEIGGNVGDAAEFARFEMIAARTAQGGLSNVGRSGNLKTIYWLGQGSKWLGRAGNAGAVLSVAIDANSVSNGTMSIPRFSYNTLGAGASIGIGAAYGGPYGALVGAGFTAGQMAYDGLMWFGDQVSQAAAQFNNGWRNGWYPGKR